ncbi:MAG TPA: twin-arginine translocase TatA/TatE family subunit [Anaerolineae bacterium]
MDSFFGIGLPELVVILILAGIVMGPQRIGQVARWLGRTTAQLQLISRSFMRQLNAELEAADQSGELKNTMQDVQDLQRQLAELRGELRSVTRGAVRESENAVRESQELLEQSIKPPGLNKPPGLKSPPSAKKSVHPPKGPAGENGASPDLPNVVDVPDDPES